MVFGSIVMRGDGVVFKGRLWRLCCTGFLYVMFGISAVGLSLLVTLPVVVLAMNKVRRVRCVRWINRFAFSLFVRCGVGLGVFEVRFIDGWRLRQPGQLIVANHPSLLDVVFLLGCVPNANCVVKRGLLRNPFLAVQVYFADYIVNAGGHDFLRHCVDSLERGESVIIFPEGTRTVKPCSYRFKRGAAYLMLMSRCAVRPVYISCEPAALGKYDAWYAVPRCTVVYRFTVMAELDVAEIREAGCVRLPLRSRRLTRWLAGWYSGMDVGGPQRCADKIRLPAGLHQGVV